MMRYLIRKDTFDTSFNILYKRYWFNEWKLMRSTKTLAEAFDWLKPEAKHNDITIRIKEFWLNDVDFNEIATKFEY